VEYGVEVRIEGDRDRAIFVSVFICSLTLTSAVDRAPSSARARAAARRAMLDLIDHVDERSVECLNALTDESWRHALWPGPRDRASSTLVSDDDEELILRVEFTSNVRPRAVKIAGASATHAREDASAPRVVKIFVNAPSLSFENAAKRRAAQVVELDGDDEVELDVTAFENVRVMTFYVESNVGGTARTEIGRIDIKGELSGELRDVSELKPC
jgi:hypothetical protein